MCLNDLPNCLVADVDPPFALQGLDVAKRKWKANVHHHCKTNDFWARLEVAKRIRFGHPKTLQIQPARLKLVSYDSTVRGAKTPGYLGNTGLIIPQKAHLFKARV